MTVVRKALCLVWHSTISSQTWNTAASPFASVLGTNYVPSSAELIQLNEILIEPQLELHRLDLEIARVQAIIDGLLSQKRKGETYIEAHRALISPIRQTPSETLAEIFQWCLPLDTAYGIRSLACAPLLLTIICRDWRRIAIETPDLWTSLHIQVSSHLHDDVLSRRIAGVESWLQRSGSLPVSLSLSATLSRYNFDRGATLSHGCHNLSTRSTFAQKLACLLSHRFTTPFSQAPILDFPLNSLESLGLDIPMTPDALMECLWLASNLIFFDFVDAGNVFLLRGTTTLQDSHLVSLTPSANNPLPLSPRLRHFRMIDGTTVTHNDVVRDWSMRGLAELITDRSADSGSLLESCDVFLCEPLSSSEHLDEIRVLQRAKEEGKLKLRLHEAHSRSHLERHKEDEPTAGMVEEIIPGLWSVRLSHMGDARFSTRSII